MEPELLPELLPELQETQSAARARTADAVSKSGDKQSVLRFHLCKDDWCSQEHRESWHSERTGYWIRRLEQSA